MNKNGLEMFADELENLIIREDLSPKTLVNQGILWELSIVTKCIDEILKYLKGYLDKEENAQAKLIGCLFYVYNLSRLLKDEKTPKNYIPKLQNILNLNRKMHKTLEFSDYNSNYKIIKEMLDISISLWLEEVKSYDLKPLKVLTGKDQENYMRLLTDLEYKHERHHENMILFFIRLIQDSNL